MEEVGVPTRSSFVGSKSRPNCKELILSKPLTATTLRVTVCPGQMLVETAETASSRLGMVPILISIASVSSPSVPGVVMVMVTGEVAPGANAKRVGFIVKSVKKVPFEGSALQVTPVAGNAVMKTSPVAQDN